MKTCSVCGKSFSPFGLCRGRPYPIKYCSKRCSLVGASKKLRRFNEVKCTGKTCRIFLVGGQSATFDSRELTKIKSLRWYLKSTGYAATDTVKGKHIHLHSLILGKKNGFVIDHINGNKLDNRKTNLRHISHSENLINVSGVRNVFFRKDTRKWTSQIPFNGRRLTLGSFFTREEAVNARKKAENFYYPGIKMVK